MVENIINIIRFFVTVIVLAIWTIIGFFLWIPFLTRMIAYFSGAVAVSAFTNVNVQEAQNRLNFAIEFYVQGFRKVIGVLHKVSSEEIKLKNIDPIDILHFLRSVAADLIWTILFWFATIIFWNRIF